MASEEGLTSLEVIGVAIKSEIDAAALYRSMARRLRNPALVAKLDFLRQEEEKHRAILEDLHARRFPDVDLQLPAFSVVPTISPADLKDKTVPDLFQLAMTAEQMAADFYSKGADRSTDDAARTVMRYLSNVENSHYHMLESEVDLVSRFPDYYNADDFHLGDEMIFLGP
jgi:rubrerythrin